MRKNPCLSLISKFITKDNKKKKHRVNKKIIVTQKFKNRSNVKKKILNECYQYNKFLCFDISKLIHCICYKQLNLKLIQYAIILYMTHYLYSFLSLSFYPVHHCSLLLHIHHEVLNLHNIFFHHHH